MIVYMLVTFIFQQQSEKRFRNIENITGLLEMLFLILFEP